LKLISGNKNIFLDVLKLIGVGSTDYLNKIVRSVKIICITLYFVGADVGLLPVPLIRGKTRPRQKSKKVNALLWKDELT
jgi:hypothetical protein